MSRVLLITTAFEREHPCRAGGERYSGYTTPTGLLAIAAVLERAGHEVVLVDPQLQEDYEQKIYAQVNKGVLFVGMSVFVGLNILNARDVSRQIKSYSPETKVIWGGPLATSSPKLCFDSACVDYIVRGMGEETIVKVADALSKQDDVSDVPNLCSKKDGEVIVKDIYYFQGDLDELPYPDLTLLEEGIRKIGSIPIFSSRGCPRNCAFCYNNTFNGRKKWYGRSGDNVLNEMEHWTEVFGMAKFYFADDNFLVNTKRACYILDEVKKRGYTINAVIGHLNDYKPEIVDKIVAAGVEMVQFAIESASERIQKLLNKPIKLKKAINMLKCFTELGIEKISTNFMFGLPSETDNDIIKNLRMACEIRDINPKIRIVPYVYMPQPQDDIMPIFPEYYKAIDFSFDSLCTVDTCPNRTRYLSPAMRPWMTKEDIEFYLDLVLAWFYHFDHVVREDQKMKIEDVYRSNQRLASLFRDIPMPS